MEATYHPAADVLVVKFVGQIAGTEGEHFAKECDKIFRTEYDKVSLDMSYVPSMNSAAIGQLLKLHKTMQRERRGLIIAGIHDNLFQAFCAVHLDKILKIKR
ncbi:MAG: STAS domain-containing protein [Deferribacteres bacterium]|nr:STAS domain-containing protein [candidate division KSB1 bacterium]MCB9500364.1 STAS domain-containing protein [Deferribacteres bacterium]